MGRLVRNTIGFRYIYFRKMGVAWCFFSKKSVYDKHFRVFFLCCCFYLLHLQAVMTEGGCASWYVPAKIVM